MFGRVVPMVLAVMLGAASARGQAYCGPGTAWAALRGERSEFSVTNNGTLFITPLEVGPIFTVDGVRAVFDAAVPVLTVDAGRYGLSGAAYEWAFMPGPHGTSGAACEGQDRIYQVERSDLDRFNRTGVATADLRDWPAALGAPVADGNGNPNDYDLLGGDRPAVVGARSAWWIMHSPGPDSAAYPPFHHVGLEMRVQASALVEHPRAVVLAFRYRIRYTHSEPQDSAFIGIWVNPEVGFYDDDYVGSDSLLQMGYVYNHETDPQAGPRAPAVGAVLVRGPAATTDGRDNDGDGSVDEEGERLTLSAIRSTPPDIFDGTWMDRVHGFLGECNWGSAKLPVLDPAPDEDPCSAATPGRRTRFWYGGDPVAGNGWVYPRGGWRAFLMSIGPFRWEPGEKKTIDWVIIWARGDDWKSSIVQLRSTADAFLDHPEWIDPPRSAADLVSPPPPQPTSPSTSSVEGPWPNPADDSATLRVTVEATARVRISLFDSFGRFVRLLQDGVMAPGRYDVSIPVRDLPSGLYAYRVAVSSGTATGSLLVVH